MERAPMIRIQVPDEQNIDITEPVIKKAFDIWYSYQPRYRKLKDYYLGDQEIGMKKDGAKITTNMCRYTVDSIVGYMAGNPITYSYDEGGEGSSDAEQVIDLLKKQNSPQMDKEVLTYMSIYGRALRLVYHDDDAALTPKSTVLSPLQAFVVYTGTVEPESIFGATVYGQLNAEGKEEFYLTVYTKYEVQYWYGKGKEGPWSTYKEPQPHKFGRVPLVEYKNSMEYMGDFEQIISLQDAYNALMSDRQDDKDSFANAMLMLQGVVLGTDPDEIKKGKKFLKENQILQLDEDAHAEYLTKTMNEGDVQTYANALMNDMHKIAKVPNMADENFANNASGVAMLYKLYGTEMLAGDKAVNFAKGETYLFKCYDAGLHNGLGSVDYQSRIDYSVMKPVFRYNVPTDISYEAQSLATYAGTGIVSKRTLMEVASIVQDPDLEEQRLAEEYDQSLQREKTMYRDEFAPENEDEEEEE